LQEESRNILNGTIYNIDFNGISSINFYQEVLGAKEPRSQGAFDSHSSLGLFLFSMSEKATKSAKKAKRNLLLC